MKKIILIAVIGLLLLAGVAGGTFYAGYNSARGYNEAELEQAAENVNRITASYVADLEKRLADLNAQFATLPDPDTESVLADVRAALSEAEGKTAEISGSYMASVVTIKNNLITLKTLREAELSGYQDLKAQIETDIEDFDGIDRAGFEQALAVVNLAVTSAQAAVDSLDTQIAEVTSLIEELTAEVAQ